MNPLPCIAYSVIGSRTSPTVATVSAVELSPRSAMPGATTRAIAVKIARMVARASGSVTATPANTTAATPISRAPSASRMFCTDCDDASGGWWSPPVKLVRGRAGVSTVSVGGGSSTSAVTPSVAAPGGPVCGVPGGDQLGRGPGPGRGPERFGAGGGSPGLLPGGGGGGNSSVRGRAVLRRLLLAFLAFCCWLWWARMSRWNCAACNFAASCVRSLAAFMSRILRSAMEASMRASSSS